MNDYIKRGDIAKLAIEEKRFVFQMEDLLKQEIVVKTVYKDFFDFIKSIPAADVAPVRHGNWDSSGKYEFANGELAIRCSECGCSLRQDEYKAYHWNYCPVCGARMDGGDG